MIHVTAAASAELDSWFVAHPDARRSVRIYLLVSGCSGLALTMDLDDPAETDVVEVVGSVTYCVNTELFRYTGALTLDNTEAGFVLETELPLDIQGLCGCTQDS